MTPSPVAHPAERAPSFDFALFRLERRFISDRLRAWARAIVRGDMPSLSPTLHSDLLMAASSLDQDQPHREALQRVVSLLAPGNKIGVTIQTNDDLFMALHDGPMADFVMTPEDIQQSHQAIHIIEPEWGEIPRTSSRPSPAAGPAVSSTVTPPVPPIIFQGLFGDYRVRALLPGSEDPSPPYSFTLHRRNGISGDIPELIDLSQDPSTLPDIAPALWDWLVARRSTVACQMGLMEWPTSSYLFI